MKCCLKTKPVFRKVILACFFFLLMSPALFAAESNQPETTQPEAEQGVGAEQVAEAEPTVPVQEKLLVKHVRLIGRDGQVEDQIVNILIVDHKLQVVTIDEISEEDVTTIVDAHQGILLGNLEIGAIANFMILDEDPRGNINVLLDTKKYTYLAIAQGVVVLNRYVDLPSPEPPLPAAKAPKKGGWIAYTPPPTSLPLSYQKGEKLWNAWSNNYFNGIFIGALAVDRQFWLSQDAPSKQQLNEDLKDYDGGEIRALRFGVAGQLKFDSPWVYTIAAATNAFDKGFETQDLDKISFFDWRLDIPISQKNTISIGKQKEPISMERLTSMVELPMAERAAVSDGLLPSRNVGIILNGYGFNQRVTWAGGFFNDWIDTGMKFKHGASQFVGRITCLPLLDPNENTLLHLGFGFRYSDVKEGIQYATEPEFNKAPLFVDTGLHDADRALTYNLETSFRTGPFWLAGEYTRTDLKAPALNDPTLDGYHVTLSWIMSGEIRPYSKTRGIVERIQVAQNVDQGGWGAWESTIRWSTFDANDGLLTGGDMDILSLGLNWYLTEKFRVNINYRHIELDKDGFVGTSDGIVTRLLVML